MHGCMHEGAPASPPLVIILDVHAWLYHRVPRIGHILNMCSSVRGDGSSLGHYTGSFPAGRGANRSHQRGEHVPLLPLDSGITSVASQG